MSASKRSRAQALLFFGDINYRTADEQRQAARLEADTSHVPVVYYMRMDRLVKIGWTVNIKRRVEAVGPQGVMAIEFGGRDVERSRHRQFMGQHSHLEWFWLRDALLEHIVSLRGAFEEQNQVTTEYWLAEHGARLSGLAGADTPPEPPL